MQIMIMISSALAHIGGFHEWPQQRESSEDIAYWVFENDWFVSPLREIEYDGTRLGIFIEKLEHSNISLEVRWYDGDSYGPWTEVKKTFAKESLELFVQDFSNPHSMIQFRSKEPSYIQNLEWDLLYPVQREEQDDKKSNPPPPPSNTSSLSQSLIDIGVISRSQWNAQSTQCSNPENDWYRMAIHHVASQQTYNGSVEARVQALQAWAISSGNYCDLPYQYLVGYDGTLWEGRPINMYSGATGGGNNNGNIAISFIGCYDQSACQSSFGFFDYETDIMMARARELIQTLSIEHSITVNSTNIKAHKDWPNNSTVCPGNFIMNRFSELLSPVSYYSAQIDGISHTEPIQIIEGESVEVWIDVSNVGMKDWDSNTKLAPYPRDVASDLADITWISPTRVQSVGSTITQGMSHRFTFRLQGNELGTSTQYFTMVQESITWFADMPFGESPTDTQISFVVDIIPSPEPTSEPTSDPTSEPTSEPTSDPNPSNLPPVAEAGNQQEVEQGMMVYLNGESSYDPEGENLYFAWKFLTETDMVLYNTGSANSYFEATEIGVFIIELIVFDGNTLSSDEVIVYVKPSTEIDIDENREETTKQGCSYTTNSCSSFLVPLLALLALRRKKHFHFT